MVADQSPEAGRSRTRTEAGRRRAVDAIFTAALDRSGEDRRTYLDDACAEDPTLRAEVEALLAACEDEENDPLTPGGALTGGLWDDLESELLAAPVLGAGARVGPYCVQREIGRGGMAVVYLAERVDGQFEQQVALKLMQRSAVSRDLMKRFLQERQILATLQHPNIARLLDGGVTEDGQPFFAMEFVPGEPIDTYCDQRHLRIGNRLRLFVAVGRAVEAAHRALVVHRDLKPSNILVTKDGEVKLLDFGIAKPLAPEGQEGLPNNITRTWTRVMTPEYASPEQVRGETVTTASDVYQLGMLLFELLTGQRAYDESTSAVELAVAICSDPPRRPSTAVAIGDEAAVRAEAQNRGVPLKRLRRRLAGDLDAIVLCALEKLPESRYASAGHLVDDVERHLAGYPIASRMDRWSARFRAFLKRNALAVTVTALAFGAVVALTIFYTSRLAAERDRAVAAAARTRSVSSFLSSIFDASDPFAASGGAATARQLLDRGIERLENELVDQPAIRAVVRAQIGDLYRKQGFPDVAKVQLERALADQVALYGDDHLDVAHTQVLLGELHLSRSTLRQARALLEKGLATQRAHLSAGDLALAGPQHLLAHVLRAYGENEHARALHEEALGIREAAFGPRHVDVAQSLVEVSRFHMEVGTPARSVPPLERALGILEAQLGADHPRVGIALGRLARAHRLLGDEALARRLYERALANLESRLGPAHPNLIDSLTGLARLASNLGEIEKAKELYTRALSIVDEIYGADSALAMTHGHDLGRLLERLGRPAEARTYFTRSLAAQEKHIGPDHPHLVDTLGPLARVTADAGDLEGGRALIERAITSSRRHPEVRGDVLPDLLETLASIEVRLGRDSEAARVRKEAAAVRAALVPEPETEGQADG